MNTASAFEWDERKAEWGNEVCEVSWIEGQETVATCRRVGGGKAGVVGATTDYRRLEHKAAPHLERSDRLGEKLEEAKKAFHFLVRRLCRRTEAIDLNGARGNDPELREGLRNQNQAGSFGTETGEGTYCLIVPRVVGIRNAQKDTRVDADHPQGASSA